MNSNENGAGLINELVRAVPPLKMILDEHLNEFGELLSHVLFARFTDWAIAAHDEKSPFLDDFADILDDWFGKGDGYVKNLILVSFLEYIPSGSGVLEHLGPLLTKEDQDWIRP
jgi:hypothetical protein